MKIDMIAFKEYPEYYIVTFNRLFTKKEYICYKDTERLKRIGRAISSIQSQDPPTLVGSVVFGEFAFIIGN